MVTLAAAIDSLGKASNDSPLDVTKWRVKIGDLDSV